MFKTTKLKLLKASALELNASGYGMKELIFNRLQDLPTVKKFQMMNSNIAFQFWLAACSR